MESIKKAQERFDQLMRDIKQGDFKYQSKPETEIDWTAYSQAKVNELRFIVQYIRQTVDSIILPEKPAGRGQPEKDAHDLAKAVLLQQYLQTNERTAEGWVDLLAPRLGISADFKWRSIARAYEREDVRYILERVFEQSTRPVQGVAHSFSGDSTGLEQSRKQNYEKDAHSEKSAGYLKLTTVMSNEFHVVTSFELSQNRGDCPMFEKTFPQTAETQDIHRMNLDAGFLSRNICTLIEQTGGLPFIYPKMGITLRKQGSRAWKDMLLEFLRDPQEWLRWYHERSNQESWYSAFKRRFAKPLQCRTDVTKASEVCARVIVENFTQLIVAFHEGRLKRLSFAA